jgi:uncharacterized protein (DUF433 family)
MVREAKMGSRTNIEHISIRRGAGGESAYVEGTRTRVSDIARLYKMMREEVIIERMIRSMPHLTPSQIAAALEYWRANADEIDDEIAEEDLLVEKLATAHE